MQSLSEWLRGPYWIISGTIFTRLSAIIVLILVPCCYEIGCLRYLPRSRKKEDTVVTSRSGERNELYHTAGISIGKREARERKPLYLYPPPVPSPSCHPKVLHFGFANVTRASAGSVDVKIFINCVEERRGESRVSWPRRRHFAGEGWMVHLNFVKCT